VEAATTDEHLRIGNGGWVCYTSGALPPVWARFREASGRLRLVELYTADEDGLDTGTLRRLPLGRLEAWVNAPDTAGMVRARLRIPGPDLRRAAAYFSHTVGPGGHWVADMLHAQIQGSGVPQAPMPTPGRARAPEPGAARKAAARRAEAQRTALQLDVPRTRRYGDGFYQQVAEAYSALARTGKAPGPALAEANEVPVSTVHRWVKEARRRGFLPPGHAGKVG
jgi:hypothetical protein